MKNEVGGLLGNFLQK